MRVRIRNLTGRGIAVPGAGVLGPGRTRTVPDSPEARLLAAGGVISRTEVRPPAEPQPTTDKEATE